MWLTNNGAPTFWTSQTVNPDPFCADRDPEELYAECRSSAMLLGQIVGNADFASRAARQNAWGQRGSMRECCLKIWLIRSAYSSAQCRQRTLGLLAGFTWSSRRSIDAHWQFLVLPITVVRPARHIADGTMLLPDRGSCKTLNFSQCIRRSPLWQVDSAE